MQRNCSYSRYNVVIKQVPLPSFKKCIKSGKRGYTEGKKSWRKSENSVFLTGLFAWTKYVWNWGNHKRKCRICWKARGSLKVQAKCELIPVFKIIVWLKVWCHPEHCINIIRGQFPCKSCISYRKQILLQ